MSNSQKIRDLADHHIHAAESILAKFKADLNGRASYAMAWSLGAFEAAADVDVWTQIKGFARGCFEMDLKDEDLRGRVLEMVTRNAMQVTGRSTSPTQNLMTEETRAAWTRANETLRYLDWSNKQDMSY